jgi:hypothetical protein
MKARNKIKILRHTFIYFSNLLLLLLESLPENSSDIAMVLNNIGNIYFSLEKYEQALEKYKDGLRRRKLAKDADPNDPDTANTLNNIAGNQI